MSQPVPPPDQTRPWWGSLLFSVVLFTLSYATSCVQRDRQADELKAHNRKLDEISAKLEEIDNRVKPAHPEHS